MLGASAMAPAVDGADVSGELRLADFGPLEPDDRETTMAEPSGGSGTADEPPGADAPGAVEDADGPGGQLAYENCDAARDAGAAPILEGEPGFAPHLDGDADGIGCERTEDGPFSYENCDAARDAGAAPILEGEPGFAPHLDGDADGIGCEEPRASAPGASEATGDGPFSYENCDAARDAGAAPILEGEPGFAPHLDGDADGIGCEQIE